MPRLKHYDNLGTARFITISCYRRLPNFNSDDAKDIFIKHLGLIRERHHLNIYGYVLMPEHVHIVMHPKVDMRLGRIVGELKSRMAREYFDSHHMANGGNINVFWQKRCYDHNCRSMKTVLEKINYCHKNPVTRGLVKNPGDWIWSSYNYYQGVLDVPLLMDKLEI